MRNSLRKVAQEFVQATARLIYPPHCNACGQPCGDQTDDIFLCSSCRIVLRAGDAPRCRRCAAELPGAREPTDDCHHCRPRNLQFDATLAMTSYDGAARAAVLRVKHRRDEALAWSLAKFLGAQLAEPLSATETEAVVPVPMHWTRWVWRGMNFPDILAKQIAWQLKLPEYSGALRRRRRTEPQGELSEQARRKNLHDAFAVAARKEIAGKRLLLVDDVITTGITCSTAAAELKTAGATRVTCMVLARTE